MLAGLDSHARAGPADSRTQLRAKLQCAAVVRAGVLARGGVCEVGAGVGGGGEAGVGFERGNWWRASMRVANVKRTWVPERVRDDSFEGCAEGRGGRLPANSGPGALLDDSRGVARRGAAVDSFPAGFCYNVIECH